jgi:O-antigen/teichoic acid export membrane protein
MLLQRAIKNGIFSMATQVVTLVLGLVFAGMTIRYLGNARAGFFLVAGLILGWFGVAGMGGFRAAAVHRLAALQSVRDWPTSRQMLGTVLSANLGVSLPFAVASVLAFPYLFSWSRLDASYRQDAWFVVALGAGSFILEQWSGTLRGVYSAHQRFDLVTYNSFVFGVSGNLARLFVLIRYKNMTSVAVVNVVVACAWLTVDALLARRLLSGWVIPLWQRAELRPLMRFGLWAWAGDIVGSIAFNLCSFITTYFLGSAPLLYISIPQRIVGQVHTFFATCSYFLFPTLAAEGVSAANAIGRVEDRLRWFVAAGTWALYVAVILAGYPLLTLMAGPDFARHAYVPLMMFSILQAINALNIVYSFSTMAIGRIHPSVVAENSASLLTAASSPFLIPWLGYIGVCWAAMWKVPAVILQCVWSRRVLGLSHSLRAEWAPYFSPMVGVLVWLSVGGLSRLLCGDHEDVGLSISLFGGGISYLATVWYLETRRFSSQSRWQTVVRVANLLRDYRTGGARRASAAA